MSTLVYRSRAVAPFSEADLHRLLEIARKRNRTESITGMLICEDDRFFQWLEGPTEGLGRIWRSIRQDARHTDIEILGESPTPVRFFGQWDMKLVTRQPKSGAAQHEPTDSTPSFIDGLYQRPEGIRTLLATLAPPAGGSTPTTPRPQDFARPVDEGPVSQADHPRAGELARLLIAAEPEASFALIDRLFAGSESMAHFCATLVEPTARVLGDLWNDDECGEFEVTLGLCRLQATVCRLSSETVPEATLSSKMRAVLVVPQPGEIHSLGAALDAELLWQAGWDTRCEHPATDDALCELLRTTRFDALDLSLSAAFGREHWLSRLTQTIAAARAASRNPALVVVVGGRAFFENDDRSAQVGADAGCATASRIEAVLSQAFGAVA